jgi:surface carbohydrate biosynthesis protein
MRSLNSKLHELAEFDFLINYEHKSREIEAVCLIKNELEKRGYSVELTCTYDEDRISFNTHKKAKVVLASALYNDACLFEFVYRVAGYCRKVVNLQWEQALTNQDESDPFFYQNPKGYAREALHLCWGAEPQNRLLRAKVSSDRAIVVGPVQMDLLRPEFSEYYYSKEDIARYFDLDASKDWVLFISSFTFVNITAEELDSEVKCVGAWLYEFQRLSVLSKCEIIRWIEMAIKENPNKIFIYRPHPSENGDQTLVEMEAIYKNFRVIKDHSVKQWIKCCDKILTWYSTAAAEVYFSSKSLTILRPVEIPYELDVSIFRNAHTISDIDDFLRDIHNSNASFPLNKALILDYFQVCNDVPSYVRICNVLEQVHNTSDYDMRRHRPLLKSYIYFQRIRHRVFFICKEIISRYDYHKLFFNNRFLITKITNHISVMSRLRSSREKNQASEIELLDIFSKINRS